MTENPAPNPLLSRCPQCSARAGQPCRALVTVGARMSWADTDPHRQRVAIAELRSSQKPGTPKPSARARAAGNNPFSGARGY